MAVNMSRSQRQDLLEGATDGKYRKSRPDTSVVPASGHLDMMHDRSQLHAPMNYGFPADEIPAAERKVPGL